MRHQVLSQPIEHVPLNEGPIRELGEDGLSLLAPLSVLLESRHGEVEVLKAGLLGLVAALVSL